ncbi:nucleolar zinc-finger protein [Coccidioides posadasii str. Silveira]|uniref:Zinc finger protein n=3 Tax=Coccidioides posadasii TaxID=199306 RepID=E9CYU9_COCPS|nr:ZPR1 zinc-finger domain containing protein [Coccidioides posadasii C735 delta SOWgp]EER26996.1 ZPR1 zinc-finger domain containing protein [Coccidioides posadasii C735 delta SOWgp]EFW21126.1 zinc finger protein [Coccidioides posadasii str. Silveira]KMM66659.1 zinc finger protein ZPR1 [Coccidioides posadasii RMSCC 3488]QVM07927.1 nucleolar zinc-finger protein [Coccidioides posadasii str. Silveira]|eukprot:XP_003069141.1 ZPR1 zinc-finger domain containing protein [Coccidioides posadasii C735 delta SOWgp]
MADSESAAVAKTSAGLQEDSTQHLSAELEETSVNKSGNEEGEEENEDDVGPMQLESLCMNCHKNGVTKILLLRIPFFRDVLLESFECPHCFFKNNSIKAAGQIQEQGSRYTLEVESPRDFERQVIKSDSAVFRLETLGIEMPKGDGQLTNVEGILSKILEQLESDQPARKIADPELYQSLETVIQKLKKMVHRESFPFTISLDDPSGNSWIAPAPHDEGNKYQRKDYRRTREQNEELGIGGGEETGNMRVSAGDPNDLDIIDGKVYSLPAECPGCTKVCSVNMQKVDIPHFKEVFIWSTVCDHCGYRTNEVKTGGAVPEKGRRITLQVEGIKDLSRDILKSDTCAVASEELDLSVQPGTLGGRFTTVEGLLTQVRDQLHGQIFEIGDEDLAPGDSMAAEERSTWERFFSRLDAAIKGELKFKILLEDPLANSYVQNLHAPDPDPQLHIKDYTRTDEEEDELGLKDMKTEGYEEDNEKDEAS